MKHKSAIMILLILLLLVGCSAAPAEVPTEEASAPTTEAAPQYPALSQEQAMIEGYVVMVDGDVRYNQQNFITFAETARLTEAMAELADRGTYDPDADPVEEDFL